MFRPLWPSSGWIRNQMKNYIYNTVHYIHTTLMYVMYHIIYSLSSDFVSNLKMAIRAETCSSDIYISDNIVVFKTVYLRTIFYLWIEKCTLTYFVAFGKWSEKKVTKKGEPLFSPSR